MLNFSQRIGMYHPNTWKQLYRFYCSESKKKLLSQRYQQKQLYGGVIKNQSELEEVDGKSSPASELLDESHTDLLAKPTVSDKIISNSNSSEFHWLIQQQQTSKYVKIFPNLKKTKAGTKKKNSLKVKSEALSGTIETNNKNNENQTTINDMKRISPTSSQSVLLTAKNLFNEFIISTRSNSDSMPLQKSLFDDDDAVKRITNYPIMCDKASDDKIANILADKTFQLPSISKVLQATMPESSRIALNRWKLAKIAELGEAGFKQYEQETLQIGKQFHLAIENYLQNGVEPNDNSPVIELWHSLYKDLKRLKPNPVLIEKQVIHPDLQYKGIIDNVSVINNEPCALEWKTSEKTKAKLYSTYDAPVQLCAYIGALNVDPRYDVKVKSGYVVVAYKNGDNAHIFHLSEAEIRKYWLIWLQRLQEYWIRVKHGTLPESI